MMISVVVPAFNEEESLSACHARLSEVLKGLNLNYELVYVNDGSSDNTLNLLNNLQAQDHRVSIVDLSRNFGKEIALTAGLDLAVGDAVIVIDADLQDPPELIPELIKNWENGYDIVYAQRITRLDESWLKRITAYTFYRVIKRLSHVNIPSDTGDFRLLSRRAVNALKQMREQHRFMKGMFSWIGFSQVAVRYERQARFAGKTKWNYWKLWNLAVEGITSFTTVPLRISTYVGFLTAAVSFIYGISIVIRTLMYGNPVPGYPSLLAIILFLGGIQLMAIGVLGEYLGRIFNETKHRPLYFLNSYKPSSEAKK